jgi:glycerol dehydrogenase-like iron-containing ADH family enzyme
MKTLSLSIPKIFIINEKAHLVNFLETYDSKQVLFIITPAVQKNISFIPSQGEISSGFSFSKEDLDIKIPELKNILKIVVVGASKILDQAKYIAFQLNIPLIAVPSILSTNAFSTDKAVLKVDGKSVSIDAKVPDEVYIIDSLLEMAPQKYNRFGLIDVLSIYTAVQDWDVAIADEQATLAIEYYLAKAILEAFLHVSTKLETNYYNITKLLLHSGLVVGMYGDGRPESGSEHIIAKVIESKINCFHAHSVSFGILVAMKLQNSWREDIASLAKNIPDWESDYGKNILNEIEGNLLCEDIKSRSGRYTVLDKVDNGKINIAIKETVSFLKQ